MKKSEVPALISSTKGKLGPTLVQLMKARDYRSTDLSDKTEITKSIISEVISGKRPPGPKTVAQLLRAFPKQSERRDLLAAFLADALTAVSRHCSDIEIDRLLEMPALAEIVRKSGADSPHAPGYLDELMENAIELGESKEHIIELIRFMIQDRIDALRAQNQSQKRR